MALFSDTVLDHFRHPRRSGALRSPSGEGWGGAPHSSRFMRIQVHVQGDTIVDARFGTYGCAPAIAAGSWLCEWAVGKTVAEAMAITDDQLDLAIGHLPEARRFCANLAVDALHAALRSLYESAQA